MAFYDAVNPEQSFYIIDRFRWWWLPIDESGATVLVVTVSADEAQIWTVAYTILVTVIFIAACELATAIVLTCFTVGDSGTRHAMLVSYYNAGSVSRIAPLMLQYLWNAVFGCRRNGRRATDWPAVRASLALFIIAFVLFSGDIVTKFFLGGKKLFVANLAQVNPGAINIPILYDPTDVYDPAAGRDQMAKFADLDATQIYQAIARAANAAGNIDEKRVITRSAIRRDGDVLPDGSLQNGTGATFQYSYNITGFEMGLRDAPELVFAVKGSCNTVHGPASVLFSEEPAEAGTSLESWNTYQFFDNKARVPLTREAYTPPWANILFANYPTGYPNETSGWVFSIVPHTAWRQTKYEKSDEPWYETEKNPSFVPNSTTRFSLEYRVKQGRPPVQCTQNDTFTYRSQTVNRFQDLQQLKGLKLSASLRLNVFSVLRRMPFSLLLGSLPFGSLESINHFAPASAELDVTRAGLIADLERLVKITFVYYREMVRSIVLTDTIPNIRNDKVLINLAKITEAEQRLLESPEVTEADFHRIYSALSNRTYVSPENGEFFLQSPDVAAMSVTVMVATPGVCAFLWFLVFLWHRVFNPKSKLSNTSAKSRHGLRIHALRAVNLYRYLDEELSRKRKWSGRDTSTPYIRDLDAVHNEKYILPASVTPTDSEDHEIRALQPNVQLKRGNYAKPKVIGPINVPSPVQEPNFFVRALNSVEGIFPKSKKPVVEGQYEVAMTQVWNPEVSRVPWKNVCEHVGKD